jgi:predicted amidohydrolase
MFDVDVGGVAYRESEYEEAGTEISSTRIGTLGVGMSICYDLRFPEVFRILTLRGARVIAVPSAFTSATGRDHWEVLLRARAIENQVFILAPNQVGEAPPHFSSYGRSAIVDPWGAVLAMAPDEECFVAAELDFAAQQRVRAAIPALVNRRREVYRWPRIEDLTG